MHKIFVYGTLIPDNPPEPVLIPGTMFSLGWFPGVILGGVNRFKAYPIVVDDAELARLDQYEGYYEGDPDSSLYLRVPYEDGQIYVYNGDVNGREVIPDGDWLSYRKELA